MVSCAPVKALVVGAGKMGGAIVFDLVRSGFTVWVTDVDPARAKEIADRYGAHVGDDFRKADVIVSAAPYRYNLDLAKCAIKARRHFCDLGGNTDIVAAELKLRPRGVTIVPDCGLQPGLGNALLGKAVKEMGGRADSARVLVGGLPLKPKGKLKYQLVFSIDGLINEYVSPVQVLRGAKLTTVTKPGDRVVVVFGAGHNYWLRHFAQETPGFSFVDPRPFLARASAR